MSWLAPVRNPSSGLLAECLWEASHAIMADDLTRLKCRESRRLSEDDIGRLVDYFYAKIRTDAELGSIFGRAIPGDWGPHLATMRNFWSSVMLTSGRYKGNPVAVHGQVAGIEMKLFERWLALFDEACR